MKFADELRGRLAEAGAPCGANDSIAAHLVDGDLDRLQAGVEVAVRGLLDALVIGRDHNTEDTPRRVAKMLVREAMRGRYEPQPKVTDFPNARKLDELYAVGPVSVRSMCSHHLVPIVGRAWFGVVPGERVIGLSKFARLAAWVMARPQIQEEATVQLADLLERLIEPRGLAVLVRAGHMCTSWRGVCDNETEMTTSVLRGVMLNKPEARAEFMTIVNGGR